MARTKPEGHSENERDVPVVVSVGFAEDEAMRLGSVDEVARALVNGRTDIAALTVARDDAETVSVAIVTDGALDTESVGDELDVPVAFNDTRAEGVARTEPQDDALTVTTVVNEEAGAAERAGERETVMRVREASGERVGAIVTDADVDSRALREAPDRVAARDDVPEADLDTRDDSVGADFEDGRDVVDCDEELVNDSDVHADAVRDGDAEPDGEAL